jgi:hypothetical protein
MYVLHTAGLLHAHSMHEIELMKVEHFKQPSGNQTSVILASS